MIQLTHHARNRIIDRHPDWTDQECQAFARFAIKCGMVSPGYNGCKRYKYLGKEFVVNENSGNPIVVTVI